jgi:IMP dehydrogenase
MTKENLITSDKSTTLEQAKEILLKNRIEKLPIVDAENHLVGLITIKDIDNQLEYPYANKDQNGRLIVGAGVGVGDDTMKSCISRSWCRYYRSRFCSWSF